MVTTRAGYIYLGMSEDTTDRLMMEWRERRGCFAEDAKVTSNPVTRACWLLGGAASIALGTVGAFVPVLPTVPFILLGSACFARSSGRFYNAVLSNQRVGPLVYRWQRTRTIPRRAKIAAVLVIGLTFGLSVGFVVPGLEAKLVMVAVGVVVAAWIASRPSEIGLE